MLDFFEQQRRARQRSRLLLLLFSLLVLLLGFLLGQLFIWLTYFWGWHTNPWVWHHPMNYLWLLFVYSSMLTPGVLAWKRYRRGGFDLALQLNARCAYQLDSPEVRLLQQVSEEMAIAANCPMPSLWVYPDDQSINSFVFGHDSKDVALFVTQRALQDLNRQQLQAMVAHEFAHIVNADLLINYRLLIMLAVLAGPSEQAKSLWRAVLPGAQPQPQRAGKRSWLMQDARDSKSSGGMIFLIPIILLLSMLFWLLGTLGLWAGRWLRARFCRQRELLADARAVQFTRMNRFLAEMLWRAEHQNQGRVLAGGMAELLQHLLLLPSQPEHWLACHPPVKERILAIGGRALLREMGQQKRSDPEKAKQQLQQKAQQGLLPGDLLWQAPALGLGLAVCADSLALNHARKVRTALPDLLLDATRQPSLALALSTGLYLRAGNSGLTPFAQAQLAEVDAGAAGWLVEHQSLLASLFTAARLPLLELSMGALQALPLARLQSWLALLPRLDRDQAAEAPRAKLDAWLVWRYLQHHLQAKPPVAGRKRLSELGSPLWVLLSYLAWANGQAGHELWQQLKHELQLSQQQWLPEKALTPELLASSVKSVQQLRSFDKPRLMELCAQIITEDGQFSLEEYERLRLLADLLGLGLPQLRY